MTASPNVAPFSLDSSLWCVWMWGRGHVSLLLAHFASLIEGARTFFPAYLPVSLWILLMSSLSLWLLQVAHLCPVLTHPPREWGCFAVTSVIKKAVSTWPGPLHFLCCISLFSLYTNGCQFSDSRSHPSVSPKTGTEVREDVAGLSVRASVSIRVRVTDKRLVWTLSSLLISFLSAEFSGAVGVGS